MLLKCRFLNQFTVSEVSKFRYLDTSTVAKAVEMCPYMAQAIRNMTSTTNTVSYQSNQEAQGILKVYNKKLYSNLNFFFFSEKRVSGEQSRLHRYNKLSFFPERKR